MKYDNEFVKRITDAVVSGKSSIREASRLLGVARSTISRWIKRSKLDHMNELLKQFENEYNNTPHSSLKYLTPNEVFRARQRSGFIWAVG